VQQTDWNQIHGYQHVNEENIQRCFHESFTPVKLSRARANSSLR